LGAAAACNGQLTSIIERAEEPIQTDHTVYHTRPIADTSPRYGFRVVATFENRTERVIIVPHCGVPKYRFIAQGPNEGEVSAYTPVRGCPELEPDTLAPGESRIDTLHVQGPNLWGGMPRTGIGVRQGRFRISYDVSFRGRGSDLRAPAPDSVAISNEFLVEIATDPDDER